MWASNKVRQKPCYKANDFDMLGTQIKFDTNPSLISADLRIAIIKFDTTCWFLRPIHPAAVDPKRTVDSGTSSLRSSVG